MTGAEIEVYRKKLDSIREAAVLVYSVITWEQDWYPAVTAGCLTALYLIVYVSQLSLITVLGLLGLLITLLDYFLPIISDKLVPRDSWDDVKEKKLDNLIRFYLSSSQLTITMITSFLQYRLTSPLYHFIITSLVLLFTAFLGSMVSGLVLSYFFLMLTLMLPGLHSRGLLAQYCGTLVNYLEEKVKGKKRE